MGISSPAKLIHNDDSKLCPMMFRVEVYEVDNAYHYPILILYHQSNLPIYIDIVLCISYVIMQSVTAVRYV